MALAGALAAGGAAASSRGEIGGVVTYRGDGPIPAGTLWIETEADDRGSDALTLTSNGKESEIAFSMPHPQDARSCQGMRIVARLKRPDGWLLARGSAQVEQDAELRVILDTVMY